MGTEWCTKSADFLVNKKKSQHTNVKHELNNITSENTYLYDNLEDPHDVAEAIQETGDDNVEVETAALKWFSWVK